MDISHENRTFVPLAGQPDPEQYLDAMLPGVQAAGSPYEDWLFGGTSALADSLRERMGRPSSEIHVGRAILSLVDGVGVGGFIAMGGAELAACRVADGIAILKGANPDERQELAQRLKEGGKLFPPVAPHEFYLSRVWISAAAGGTGYGPRLVRQFLAAGRQQGFSCFVADVCSANTGVLSLGRFHRFLPVATSASEAAGMAYVRIVRDEARGQNRHSASPA